MGRLRTIDEIDSFAQVRRITPDSVIPALVAAVKNLDEREELEPFVRRILFDEGETPHGPAEIVDILTHKVTIDGRPTLGGFILKGKSFRTVRHRDVAHQIYRLEKIAGLGIAAFFASGIVLDQAKEHFVSTASRLGVDYVLADARDIARLLVAYGFYCPRDARPVRVGRCICGYSPQKRFFNVLQQDALKWLATSHALGQPGGLVVLPPGGGKTRVAAEDAKRMGSTAVLYVAHTHEILDVAESELQAVFGADNVTRCSTRDDLISSSPVRLATIQLLGRYLPDDEIAADYLVVDEFHHAAAPTYRLLIDSVRHKYLLGLTATPFRGDRQDIVELCNGNIVVQHELRTGIDTGILTPYHYFGCFDDIDYTRIRHNGVRYDVNDLERALTIPERDQAIISQWREHADGLATIAFCSTRKHAERFASALAEASVPSAVYLDDTPRSERQERLLALSRGDIRVLCAVDVLNEGADIPFVECLLFLRPTDSQRVFYQQLGRGLRQYPGKARCIVVDFIGNFKNAFLIPEYHGLLPELDGFVGMEGRPWNRKTLLNLPLGCTVNFDERVIDIFARQTLDPRFATRHNIANILIYQYEQLERRLGRRPSRDDVNRSCVLDASFYALVFRSWRAFERLVQTGR